MLLLWEAVLWGHRGASLPLEVALARFLRRSGRSMVKGACLPHLDSPQRSYLQVGLHVTYAIRQLLSVFMPFCSSLSKVSRDEQIKLVTSTKVPGGFAWRQYALYELGLGGGEVSGLFTKIRMVLNMVQKYRVRGTHSQVDR